MRLGRRGEGGAVRGRAEGRRGGGLGAAALVLSERRRDDVGSRGGGPGAVEDGRGDVGPERGGCAALLCEPVLLVGGTRRERAPPALVHLDRVRLDLVLHALALVLIGRAVLVDRVAAPSPSAVVLPLLLERLAGDDVDVVLFGLGRVGLGHVLRARASGQLAMREGTRLRRGTHIASVAGLGPDGDDVRPDEHDEEEVVDDEVGDCGDEVHQRRRPARARGGGRWTHDLEPSRRAASPPCGSSGYTAGRHRRSTSRQRWRRRCRLRTASKEGGGSALGPACDEVGRRGRRRTLRTNQLSGPCLSSCLTRWISMCSRMPLMRTRSFGRAAFGLPSLSSWQSSMARVAAAARFCL